MTLHDMHPYMASYMVTTCWLSAKFMFRAADNLPLYNWNSALKQTNTVHLEASTPSFEVDFSVNTVLCRIATFVSYN